jgi:26S proteasome regulatory subunit T1
MSLMSNKSPNLVICLCFDFLISVVALGERVSPTDIEEGMRVGVDRQKYSIQLPLPPKIDPSVTMMQVEDKPDVTYSDVGGCKEQIERLREVVEVPLLSV